MKSSCSDTYEIIVFREPAKAFECVSCEKGRKGKFEPMAGMGYLVKRGTSRPKPKRSFSRSLASTRFSSFFPFRPLFGHPVLLTHSLFSRSRTTPSPLKSHRTFRRVWPRFQPKSARGAVTVPVKRDRNVEKTHTRTLSGVKGHGTRCCPQRRGYRYSRCELFCCQPRRNRRRTCKSVRFRSGSVPSPLFFHYLFSPIIIIIIIINTLS